MKDLYLCTTFIVFASLSVGCGTLVGEPTATRHGVSFHNNGNQRFSDLLSHYNLLS